MLHAAGAVGSSGCAHVLLGKTGAGKSTIVTELVAGGWSLLDDVGTRFWQLVEQGTTFGVAVTTLLQEYEVERETLVADLTALVADLRENGLVAVDAS